MAMGWGSKTYKSNKIFTMYPRRRSPDDDDIDDHQCMRFLSEQTWQ